MSCRSVWLYRRGCIVDDFLTRTDRSQTIVDINLRVLQHILCEECRVGLASNWQGSNYAVVKRTFCNESHVDMKTGQMDGE